MSESHTHSTVAERKQEWSEEEMQGMEELYESLINVPVSNTLNTYQIVSAYLQATCVAAEIPFNADFYKEMLLKLAEQSQQANEG